MNPVMKKVLVLTTRFPYPVIGGDRLRIYNVCRELAKKHELTLLSLCETKEEMEMEIPNDNVFTNIERVYLPKWKSYLNCLRHFVFGIPLQVSYYRSKKFERRLCDHLNGCDVVIAHLIRSAYYLKECKKPKIVEMTDAISMNYQRIGSIGGVSGLRAFLYKVECRKLREFERKVVNLSDASVVVSQFDKDFLFAREEDGYKKILVCSNGVDFNNLKYYPEVVDKSIVFIGNMNSLQNMDAATWFADKVMPKLLLKGSYNFKVVGRISARDSDYLSKFPGVEVIGAVDNIANSVKGACAAVCPMRIGAGVQNKVLEYMALGIPAIVSEIGKEGIDALPGKEILIANDAEEYVEKIELIVNDAEMRREITHSARLYVENNHSWDSKLYPFSKLVDNISVN